MKRVITVATLISVLTAFSALAASFDSGKRNRDEGRNGRYPEKTNIQFEQKSRYEEESRSRTDIDSVKDIDSIKVDVVTPGPSRVNVEYDGDITVTGFGANAYTNPDPTVIVVE